MKNNNRNAALKALLDKNRCVVAPAAFDALSAKLVQETNYDVVYIGSYGTAASSFGLPDVGLLSIEELARHARAIVNAVDVPVIADAEGGATEAANVWRTVKEFEDAGVSAIHIEDHAGRKHTDLPQELIPLESMVAKLRAALAARSNPDFQIIARTDAIWALGDKEEACRRVRAFADLGVDMIFPCGADLQTAAQLRAKTGKKVAVIETPTGPEFAAAGGADLVIHYGFCLYAASKGILHALRRYREGFRRADVQPFLEDESEFEKRFGYKEFSDRAQRFDARQNRI